MSKYILLIIGILGILAGISQLFTSDDFTDSFLGFICGSSLVWGYFELKRKENEESK